MCVCSRVRFRWQFVVGVSAITMFSLSSLAGAQVSIDSRSSTHPYVGVEHVSGRVTLRVDGRKANFDATLISLCNDYIHVDATEPGLGLMTPAAWGRRAGVQVAINGDFFTSSYVYGDAAGGGARWPASSTGVNKDGWFNKDYGWIAFGENWVDYTHTKQVKKDDASYPSLGGWRPDQVAPDPPEGTFAMVSGFPELVVEGQLVKCSSPTADTCFKDRSDMRARHPRSAMGVSKDRKTFILLAVDGRSSSSAGMYGTELAALMKELGAHVAFNIDGGGSTGLWIKKKGYVNVPSDGSARSVKNHWGIFAGSGSGMSQVPGSCVDLPSEPEPQQPTVGDASVSRPEADASVPSARPDASVGSTLDGSVDEPPGDDGSCTVSRHTQTRTFVIFLIPLLFVFTRLRR